MDRREKTYTNPMYSVLKTSDKIFDLKIKKYISEINLQQSVHEEILKFFKNLSDQCYPNNPGLLFKNSSDFRSMYINYDTQRKRDQSTETIDVYNATLMNEKKLFQTVNEVFSTPFIFSEDKMDLGPSHWQWYDKMFQFENGKSSIKKSTAKEDLFNPFYRCIIGGNFGSLVNVLTNKNSVERIPTGLIDTKSYIQIWKGIRDEFHKNFDPASSSDFAGFSPISDVSTDNNRIVRFLPLRSIEVDPEVNFYSPNTQSYRFESEVVRHKIKNIVQKSLMALIPKIEDNNKYANTFLNLFESVLEDVSQTRLVDNHLIYLEESAYITKFINKYNSRSSLNEKADYFRRKVVKMRNLLDRVEAKYKQQYYELKYTWLLLGFQLFFNFKENISISHLFLYFISKTREGNIWRQVPIEKISDGLNFREVGASFSKAIDEAVSKNSKTILRTLRLPLNDQFYNYAYPTMHELFFAQLIEHPDNWTPPNPYMINESEFDRAIRPKLRIIFEGKREPTDTNYKDLTIVYLLNTKYNLDFLLKNFRPDITPLKKKFESSKYFLKIHSKIKYYVVLLFVETSANLIRIDEEDRDLVLKAISYVTRETEKRNLNLDNPMTRIFYNDNNFINIVNIYYAHIAIFLSYSRFLEKHTYDDILQFSADLSMDLFNIYFNAEPKIIRATSIMLVILRTNPSSILGTMSKNKDIHALYKTHLVKYASVSNTGLSIAINSFFTRANIELSELLQFYFGVSDKKLVKDGETKDTKNFAILVQILATSEYSEQGVKVVYEGQIPPLIRRSLLEHKFVLPNPKPKPNQTGGHYIDRLRYKANKYKQRYLELKYRTDY